MIGELNHPVENEYFSKFNIKKSEEVLNFAPRYTINENGKIDIESFDVVFMNKELPLTNIKTIGNYE